MSFAQQLDLSGLSAATQQALAAAVGKIDLRPALRQVALYLNSQARRNFVNQSAPDGTPWARFKHKPSARRGGASAKLLRDTGVLMASLTGQAGGHVEDVTAFALRWGTNVPYAKYQNFGTRHLPARPFVGLTPAMVARIEQIIVEYLRKASA